MTEKSYGGNDGVREHTLKKTPKARDNPQSLINQKKKLKKETQTTSNKNINNLNELESYQKAGEISVKIREFAKNFIKPDMLLVEIAQKIHKEIEKNNAIPAFPVNLSLDDIAAHYHPTLEDEKKASGLLKIDIGISVNGYIADTAFSLDLTPDKKHKKLIESAEQALESALKIVENNPTLNDIGKTIKETIEKKGFSPVINLSGHSLSQYNVHAGITIPNYANNNQNKLDKGAFAIEPFATTGEGKIYEGPPGNIYSITKLKNTRSPTARKILDYVWNKYQTLPFSLREIQEKFGNMSKFALKELEQNSIIRSYPQFIEISHKPVAQAEHTFIKTPYNKIIITTR